MMILVDAGPAGTSRQGDPNQWPHVLVLAWRGDHSLEDIEEQPELLAALVQPEQWLTSFLFKREKGKKL